MTTGIHSLPAELLLPIFDYASLDDRPLNHPSALNELDWATSTRRDPSTSIHISQVCSRWRQLSLFNQALWKHLPRLHETLTSIYLSRCASGALDVEIRPEHLHGAMKEEQVQMIFGLIPRASSLFVSCKPSDVGADGNLGLSALVTSRKYPSIRSFLRTWDTLDAPSHLVDLRMDLQWEVEVANIFVEVPRKSFRGQPLEKLRSARFNYVLMRSPRTFIWPGLRFAELTNSQAWDSATNFVAFFSGVPLLEDFKFTRNYGGTNGGLPALDTTGVHGLPPLRSVRMANLKSFVLHGPYYDIFFTLALLELPCHAIVSLTLTGRWIAEYANEKLEIMHDALVSHFAEAARADACFDSVTFNGRTMIGAHSSHPSGTSPNLVPPSFTLSVIPDDEPSPDETCHTFDTLCSHPVFTHAPNLTIVEHDSTNRYPQSNRLRLPEIWRVFELYTYLSSLTLRGTFLCALFSHTNLRQRSVQASLSNLTSLRLVDAKLSNDFADWKGCVVIETLVFGIKRLSEKFERLELERCTIGAAAVRDLREGLSEGILLRVGCGPRERQ